MDVIARRYRPIVYIEGVRIPVRRVVAKFACNGKSTFQITLPPDPRWKSRVTIENADGTATDEESGLPIRATYDLRGTQPKTIFHVWCYDDATQEEVFVGDARLHSYSLVKSKEGTYLVVNAVGSAYFLEEVAMYMVDTGRSLGIDANGGGWGSRQGTAQTSSVSATLKSEGLTAGLFKLMEDAGLHSNQYSNLVWKLLNMAHRIAIVNNSKALGYFDATKLGTLLDKTIAATSSRQPIAAIILNILSLIRYLVLNVPAPSFMNAKYAGIGAASETSPDLAAEDIPTPVAPNTNIRDLEIENVDELNINDLIYLPQLPFSPAPRCNVLFPNQFDTLAFNMVPETIPTRGLARISGSGALSETYTSNAIYIPEDFSEGLQQHGKQYVTMEEAYRGVVMSTFSFNKPEYVDDMGSDYVKNYLKQSYYVHKYINNTLNVVGSSGGCPLNLKPIPGFPSVILSPDGDHYLAFLEAVQHTFDASQGSFTDYTFSCARPYDDPTPPYGGDLWMDDMYKQENVGVYVYPSVIGRFYTTLDVINSDERDDMSILKHLFATPDMTVEEVKAAKQADDAIRLAVDAIWEEYSQNQYKDLYEYNYGRRIPIGIGQLFMDFLGAGMSNDQFMAIGGYTLKTNSVTLRNQEELGLSVGDTIPEDARIAGCFCKERQDCYSAIAANLYFSINVAKDSTEALDLLINSVPAVSSSLGGVTVQEQAITGGE